MRRRWGGSVVGGTLLLAAGGFVFWGISTRAHDLSLVTQEAAELAVPTVTVIAPERGAPQQEIVLPGTMEALTDAPIYARTNGYVKSRHVDIGARVRTGQVLAEIDTPEIERQLEQGRADLATAEANAKLAETTAERYRDLIKTDSVSRQDLDNANGSLEARTTAVASARANVSRLEQLRAFDTIVAPFDGVITARNIDVGALIDQGGTARELFHIAAVQRLRVFVNVPEVYSRAARNGLKAEVTLSEYPGRQFAATLARTAEAIDVRSRTLLTELDVDNAKGELLPGSFAEVHLKLPTAATTFKLPINALVFSTDGLRVATVSADERVVMAPIALGRDYGSSVEVVSGLHGGEKVILDPPDSLEAGQPVRIAGVAR